MSIIAHGEGMELGEALWPEKPVVGLGLGLGLGDIQELVGIYLEDSGGAAGDGGAGDWNRTRCARFSRI
jgi:hypothetical protein